MVAGSVLQRLVVAHPMLTTPVRVNLRYTAYQGWLYSGISRWSMDRIIVTNGNGKEYSFCTRGLLLPSGITVTVTLTAGLCVNTLHAAPPSHPNFPNYPYETYTPDHTNLSKLTLRNSSSEFSEWVPLNTTSEFDGYVTKHVIPGDIDNLLHEHESFGPSGAHVPTRLLLGTTRSLKSRPIVLRNRVREGRGMNSTVYYIPARVKRKRSNEMAMRQVGMKMMEEGGRWSVYKRGRKGMVALRRRKGRKNKP